MFTDWKNVVKMATLPKMIYRVNSIPIKIPMKCLAKVEKFILKFTWNLSNQVTVSHFPIAYHSFVASFAKKCGTVTKRHTDSKRIESLKLDPYLMPYTKINSKWKV